VFKYDKTNDRYDVFVYEPTGRRIMRVRIDGTGNTNTETFINNYQGSPVVVLDNSQNIKYQKYLDPWGNMEMEIGHPSSNIEFQYTDKELDEDTDLYYFQARYYDPKTNHFKGRDRVKLEDNLKNYFGINAYVFVNNNPLTNSDPDGRNPYSSSEMYIRYVFEYGMHTTPENFVHEMPRAMADGVKQGIKDVPDIALTAGSIGAAAVAMSNPALAGTAAMVGYGITGLSVAKTGIKVMDGDTSKTRGAVNIATDFVSSTLSPKASIGVGLVSFTGNTIVDNIGTFNLSELSTGMSDIANDVNSFVEPSFNHGNNITVLSN
jgi:RHS repeat-associated protein